MFIIIIINITIIIIMRRMMIITIRRLHDHDGVGRHAGAPLKRQDAKPWLRTSGVDSVNANGAAAKVRDFDTLGKKARPGTFGKIKVD